jgi:predicted nucleic acid-binding protein
LEELRAFFFDSYAFYEVLAGNERYKPYIQDIAIVTTKMNLMELHYGLLAKYGKESADKLYDEYSRFAIEIDDSTIKDANEMRLSLKKRDLSYVDCIGYVLARKRRIPFLTGDRQFKDMDNVEFVK